MTETCSISRNVSPSVKRQRLQRNPSVNATKRCVVQFARPKRVLYIRQHVRPSQAHKAQSMWQAWALLMAAVTMMCYYALQLMARRERDLIAEISRNTTPRLRAREQRGVPFKIRARKSATVQATRETRDIADAEERINQGHTGQPCTNHPREMSTQLPDVAGHDVRAKSKPSEQRVQGPPQKVYDDSEDSLDGDSFRRTLPRGRAVASSTFVDRMAQQPGGRNSTPRSAVKQAPGSYARLHRQKSRVLRKVSSTSSLPDRHVSPSMPHLTAREQRVLWWGYDENEDSSSDEDRFLRAPSTVLPIVSSGCRSLADVSPVDGMAQHHRGLPSSKGVNETARPSPSVLRQEDRDVGPLTSDLSPSQARMLRQEQSVRGDSERALYPPPPPSPPAGDEEDAAGPYEPILPYEQVRGRLVMGHLFAELAEEEQESMGRTERAGLPGRSTVSTRWYSRLSDPKA